MEFRQKLPQRETLLWAERKKKYIFIFPSFKIQWYLSHSLDRLFSTPLASQAPGRPRRPRRYKKVDLSVFSSKIIDNNDH